MSGDPTVLAEPDLDVIARSNPAPHVHEGPVFRIYTANDKYKNAWDTFRYAGPKGGQRFEPWPPPDESGRSVGVSYVALDSHVAAFAETFQDRIIDLDGTLNPARRKNGGTQPADYYLTEWVPERPLSLLDVTDGEWTLRLGVGNRGWTGPDKAWCTRWSSALHAAFPETDGIFYKGINGGPCAALYGPPVGVLPDKPRADVSLRTLQGLGLALEAASKVGYRIQYEGTLYKTL